MPCRLVKLTAAFYTNRALSTHLTSISRYWLNCANKAKVAGKFDAAISAEHKRGQALGFYVHRSESGKPGDFTSGMRADEIDRELVVRDNYLGWLTTTILAG
jgi:hypothetical protein